MTTLQQEKTQFWPTFFSEFNTDCIKLAKHDWIIQTNFGSCSIISKVWTTDLSTVQKDYVNIQRHGYALIIVHNTSPTRKNLRNLLKRKNSVKRRLNILLTELIPLNSLWDRVVLIATLVSAHGCFKYVVHIWFAKGLGGHTAFLVFLGLYSFVFLFSAPVLMIPYPCSDVLFILIKLFFYPKSKGQGN